MFLQISAEFFELCWALDVPFVWENPLTSFMWDHRLARRIARLEGVSDLTLHACAFGARWYKPTRLRVFGLRHPERLAKTCKRTVQDGKWLCQHTGQAHVILQGRDENGVNWTARAAAYPKKLAKALADVFIDTAFCRELARNLNHGLRQCTGREDRTRQVADLGVDCSYPLPQRAGTTDAWSKNGSGIPGSACTIRM